MELQLFIRYHPPHTEKYVTTTINIFDTDTIGRLKEIYRIKNEFPYDYYTRLLLYGQELFDDKITLKELNIVGSTCIHHIDRLRGD